MKDSLTQILYPVEHGKEERLCAEIPCIAAPHYKELEREEAAMRKIIVAREEELQIPANPRTMLCVLLGHILRENTGEASLTQSNQLLIGYLEAL